MTIDEALVVAKRFLDEVPEEKREVTLRADPKLRAELWAAVATYFEFMRTHMNGLSRLLASLPKA
jgi:hypothetical protein